MKQQKGINEVTQRNKLRRALSTIDSELEQLREKIENRINKLDKVELLSNFSLVSQFGLQETPELNSDLREEPYLHFLVGLCLKKENKSKRLPKGCEIEKIVNLIKKYFVNYYHNLLLESLTNIRVSEADSPPLLAKIIKLIGPIHQDAYTFQLKGFTKEIFQCLDDYFKKNIGFTIEDAIFFGEKILYRYEKLVNERFRDAGKARNRAFNLFYLTRQIFCFNVEQFCKEENIEDRDKFKKYLKAVSCKFGEGDQDYNEPLDENLIISKPIININDHEYFCPIPQDLIDKLPVIFENLLANEKKYQTNTWQRYQKQRAIITENKVLEYFSRIFPENNIYKNLKYTFDGKDCELDILVFYDNKLFIIEVKSGSLTEPAQRGAIKRLKSDLGKLIEEAYFQGKRAIDYIQKERDAIFFEKNTGRSFKIESEPEQIDFFLINVTLEPLMGLATGLKKLQSLDLFADSEFPWSVNFFILDIITQHLPLPPYLIHYIEKRLEAQDKDIFYSFDELGFLCFYLEKGNFYTPSTDNQTPDSMIIDSIPVRIFDDHYLYGKQAPALNIEDEWAEIINILIEFKKPGYTDIISTLLDFDHEVRKRIIGKIKELIEKSTHNGESRVFTLAYDKVLDTGFTFMTQLGRMGLRERMFNYCTRKKHETQKRRWLGIGRDILDKRWLVNEFVFLDSPWENNTKIEDSLRNLPEKETIASPTRKIPTKKKHKSKKRAKK